MRIKIYQLDGDKDKNGVKFMSHEFTMKHGGIDPKAYKCVYHGDVKAMHLDNVFNIFNGFREDYIGTYQGHSLSVSDVVEVIDDIPEVYGKIDFLYAGEDHVAKVGDTVYYTDSDDFYDMLRQCQEENIAIQYENLAGQHIRLAEKGFFFCDSITGWQKIDFDPSLCEDMNGIRALMILPNRKPVETRVVDDYKMWQRAVSRNGEPSLMEVTYPFDDSAVIVSNEEAKLIGMEGNRRIGISIYAGPMFIVNDDDCGNFCDLTDEQIKEYSRRFEHPEDISQEAVQNDCGFTFIAM